MTDLPDVKIKAVVSFPAVVVGGIGLAVSKNNGAYIFDFNYGELAPVSSVPTAAYPSTYLVLWNSQTNTYNLISLTSLKALP